MKTNKIVYKKDDFIDSTRLSNGGLNTVKETYVNNNTVQQYNTKSITVSNMTNPNPNNLQEDIVNKKCSSFKPDSSETNTQLSINVNNSNEIPINIVRCPPYKPDIVLTTGSTTNNEEVTVNNKCSSFKQDEETTTTDANTNEVTTKISVNNICRPYDNTETNTESPVKK